MTGSGRLSRYATPEAMLAALTDHLRRRARETGIEHANLRRQFAYDRLLARVFAENDHKWVLKGGTALLARVRNARHTLDIDLARKSGTIQTAAEDFRSAAAIDLGDHIRFELGVPASQVNRTGQPGVDQARLPVTALIGTRVFERFHVDVVVGSIMTAEPEAAAPSIVVQFDDLTAPTYLLYPVVDHLADKVCATIEKHGERGEPSTRSRDLVDLVVLARTQSVAAAELKVAIEAERLHRRLPRIEAFIAPPNWAGPYARDAKAVAECAEYPTVTAAVQLVGRFLDPILAWDQPDKTWSPTNIEWR